MTKEKIPGKRAVVREQKEALRREISETKGKIIAALSASRVPDRVVQGDVRVAQEWKDAVELGEGAAYHIKNQPSEQLTADGLAKVKRKLERVLASLV